MLRKTEFAERLLRWYDQEARVLPWRSEPTPYRVWISEMMLQQTRVETVIPYFQRFVAEIPNIATLASIDEEKLLKLWQGLGYYSRAMNLKKAAILLQSEYGGQLPSDRKTLQKLPGIGPYSAGAISSIAFQKRETLMDGNVLRVMARIEGITSDIGEKITQQRIERILEEFIPAQRPGDFNQALMELGATRCLPNGAPLCESCPMSKGCIAAIQDQTGSIPLKSTKKPRDIQNKTVLLLHFNQSYAIEKRKSTGLLANMWSFPMIEGHISIEACESFMKEVGFTVTFIEPLPASKHIFTHIEWWMNGYEVHVEAISEDTQYRWVTRSEIDDLYAIPTAHAFFLKFLK